MRICGVAVAVLLALQAGAPASGTETKLMQDDVHVQRPGTTGTGTQDEGAAVSGSVRAGGQGTLLLGGKRRPLYHLAYGDALSLGFLLSPEYDQQLTVQPDGYVRLKDAAAIYALGLTVEEFRTAVLAAYQGYLHDPKISVALKDFARPYFVAGGELARPGKYDLRAETTVLEAVEMAGGFTPRAKHSQVVLFRKLDDERYATRLLNVKKMLATRDLSENPALWPGDLVYVPQNMISKIAPFVSRPSVGMYVSPTQF